jgi:hypothetical protein
MTQIEPAMETIVEWSEVKHAFLTGYETGNFPQKFGRGRGWCKGERNSWNGCTADEMAGWLRSGFESPEFPIGDSYIPKAESRRMVFGEEGELDLTLAWSGHDYPYLSWETRKSKPGLRMLCEFGFSGAISDELIAKYGAWIMGILEGLSTRGYDIELDIRFTTHEQNSAVRGNGLRRDMSNIHSTIIRVKRENELTDLSDFSALFSPGGYRILMFLATALAADKLNAQLDGGIGSCVSKETSVDYNAETATLDIWANQMSAHYDFEAMSKMVEDALGLGE